MIDDGEFKKKSDRSSNHDADLQYQLYIRGNSCYTLHNKDEIDITPVDLD